MIFRVWYPTRLLLGVDNQLETRTLVEAAVQFSECALSRRWLLVTFESTNVWWHPGKACNFRVKQRLVEPSFGLLGGHWLGCALAGLLLFVCLGVLSAHSRTWTPFFHHDGQSWCLFLWGFCGPAVKFGIAVFHWQCLSDMFRSHIHEHHGHHPGQHVFGQHRHHRHDQQPESKKKICPSGYSSLWFIETWIVFLLLFLQNSWEK